VLIARVIAEKDALLSRFEAAYPALVERGMTASIELLGDAGGRFMAELSIPDADIAIYRDVLDRFGPLDALVSERNAALPSLFISDMDSTMIGQECIDELADFAGLKPQIAAITERAMQGELDFESALRERVRLLAGLDEGAIARCLAERIRPMPGAKTLVATLKAKGCHTVLVTGGFHQFADPVAAELGFDHVVANRLEVVGGKLTGGLLGGIVDSSVKAATLEERLAARGGTSLATGDGANDIPMIEAATYGVAYHAKPKARAAANGWIDCGDLTDVLRLLGIPESEWSYR
jgi:phosphoserine phosphatase